MGEDGLERLVLDLDTHSFVAAGPGLRIEVGAGGVDCRPPAADAGRDTDLQHAVPLLELETVDVGPISQGVVADAPKQHADLAAGDLVCSFGRRPSERPRRLRSVSSRC